MKSKLMILAALTAATVVAKADIYITEVLYTGLHGEFVELTNVGGPTVDFAAVSTNGSDNGWKFSDNRQGTNVTGTGTLNAVSLAQVGLVAAGESIIVTEVSDAIFIQAWYTEPAAAPGGSLLPGGFTGLAANKIVENNFVNLGRTDKVFIYDEDDNEVARLLYTDQSGEIGSNGYTSVDLGVRSEEVSAIPLALGNTFNGWRLSTNVASLNEWKSGVTSAAVSIAGSVGSPGYYPN